MFIGNFSQVGDSFARTIKTLTFKIDVVFEHIETKSEKAPEYRVTTGHTDIGVAWKKTSEADNAYLSVLIDDPTFPAPVQCRLVKTARALPRSVLGTSVQAGPDRHIGRLRPPARLVPRQAQACGSMISRDGDTTAEFFRRAVRLMCIDRDRHATKMLHPISLKGTSNMLNRIHAALAALLAVATIAPGPVLARNMTTDRNSNSHSYYGYQLQVNDLMMSSGARGFSTVPTALSRPNVRPFETDPDAHIRFEMNRDDRDRRLGGS